MKTFIQEIVSAFRYDPFVSCLFLLCGIGLIAFGVGVLTDLYTTILK